MRIMGQNTTMETTMGTKGKEGITMRVKRTVFLALALLIVESILPVRADPPWSSDVQVSKVTNRLNWRPDIAADEEGNIYVVWKSRPSISGSGPMDVYFAKSTTDGVSWSVSVVNDQPADIPDPAITVDPFGNVHAVWSNAQIYCDKLAAGSTDWGVDVQISKGSFEYQTQPDIAVDDVGNLYVIWVDDWFSLGSRICFARSVDGGTSWSDRIQVSEDAEMLDCSDPAISVDGQGNAWAVWSQHNRESAQWDVYSAKLFSGSTSWSSSIRVNDVAGSGYDYRIYPDIVVDNLGNVYAIWRDDRNGTGDIYFAKLPAGATVWTPNVRVHDVPGWDYSWDGGPRVAVDTEGNVYALWEDFRNVDSNIYSAKLLAGLSDWGPNIRVNDDVPVGGQGNPAIAVDSGGKVYAVWWDSRHISEGRDDIYFSYCPVEDEPEPSCDLSRHPPVLLVSGWGGSEASLAVDEQLHYFRDWLGPDYVEGCNLFYVRGVAADNNLDENAMAIQRSLQEAYEECLAIDPAFDGHFDIIAHSYGGINSRAYLESGFYVYDVLEKGISVDNLFTMGSPHGGEYLPTAGAVKIVLKHLIDPGDWGSLWQILPWKMEEFNNLHTQMGGCYRLIGGNAYEQDLPKEILDFYSPYLHIPNDLGVRVASAQELNREEWEDKYPNVLTATTPDIHGYFEGHGLADYRSYVHPADTFNEYIKEYLGEDHCVSDGKYISYQRISVASSEQLPAVPAVILDSEVISSETEVSGTFQVDWQGQSVIYLVWPLGELEIFLTDPEGELIDASTVLTNPNVDYFELETLGSLASFVFTNTITGSWGYTVTADTLPYSVPYQLSAISSLPTAVTAETSSWQRKGEEAVITATLSYSGGIPLTDGQVEAQVFRPDGRMDVVGLLGGDDGVYTAEYIDTDVGGYYGVLVEATGIYQTQPYTRHAETVFSVATGFASLIGSYGDQPRDTDGDGFYEWLDIDVGVNVTQVGTYTLAADLVAEDGSYIDHAMARRAGLVTGAHNLTLSFDGDAILESKEDGPYTITHVLLVDSEYASLLLDQVEDAYITASYYYWQFGSGWRLYLPLILRSY